MTICLEPGCPNIAPCMTHPPKDRRSPSSKVTGRRDWKAKRLRVLNRDHWRCYLCGVDLNTLPPMQRQVDHVKPVARTQGHTDTDLAACCGPCNNRKNGR